MAQNYTFTNIDYPGAMYTFPQAVNDSGHVVGFWGDSEGNNHGFYWDGTTFTSIDYPGAGATFAQGINNAGVISGLYLTNNGTQAHGYILNDGTFTSYDYPGFAGQTDGEGINNHGVTTGYYGSGSNSTGFFNNDGSFSSFSYPGACATIPYSLNDSEQATGNYRPECNTGFLGFFYSNGTFTSLDYPDGTDTYAYGVNNAGVVTGYSTSNDPPYLIAWLWQNGTFTAVATDQHYVEPFGINNTGQLVGVYEPNTTHGFIATPTAGQPLQFEPILPCRVVDTRNPNGTFGGPPIPGGTARSFPLPQSTCGIPQTASAYSLNVTLVPLQGHPVHYLTIWPTGQTQPQVSTMNSLDGRVKANAAIVPGGTGGAVSVYVTDTTNVILDIDGYFEPASALTLTYYPLTPCRVADTRSSQFPQGLGTPHLSAGVARDFPVLNSPCIPPNANAVTYSFNLTAIPYQGSRLGYLEVWPTGFEPPSPVSTLNNPTGTTVANAAIVPAGNNGEITVYGSNDTDLAIDINGYFASPNGGGLQLYTTTPCRVIDTRNVGNGQPFMGVLSPPVNVTASPCGILGTAQAYVFNATVVPPGAMPYLTLWPDGEGQPAVSTLNALDGFVTSNMAVVPNHGDGKIDAYAQGLTQLILDISAYFAP